MKKFLSLLLFLVVSINSVTAATYGCKTYNIKRKKTFITTYKQKNGNYNKNANVGRHYNSDGQCIGTFKKKGKRIVAYDFKGHRISYCKRDSKGRMIHYNRSGIACGYCD